MCRRRRDLSARYFLSGDIWHQYFAKEVSVRKKNAQASTKRALRHTQHEWPPSLPPLPSFPVLLSSPQLLAWETWVDTHPLASLEVYTDGSMRYTEHTSGKFLMQPKSIRRSTFAQGGILFHCGPAIPGTDPSKSLTITIEDGAALNLSLASSTELYAITLAA